MPLVVIAGREYGSGSSRDWAAKGPSLLGVRRGHRRELRADPSLQPRRDGHPAAPVQAGRQAASLGLTGREVYAILGLAGRPTPRQSVTVVATADDGAGGDGRERRFEAIARLDGPIDVDYYVGGGIMPVVLRRLAAEPA